jgi:hypothetical protein
MQKLIWLLMAPLLLVIIMVGCTEIEAENAAKTNKQAQEQETEGEKLISIIEEIETIDQADGLLQFMNQHIQAATTNEVDTMIKRLQERWETTIETNADAVFGLMALSDNTYQQMMDNFDEVTHQINSENIENVEARKLIEHCQQAGLGFFMEEGCFYIAPWYGVLEPFTAFMSEKMATYIALIQENTINPVAQDAMLCITWEQLADRIKTYENYLMNIDESDEEILMLYRNAVTIWLAGVDNSPIFLYGNGQINPEVLQSYQSFQSETPTTEMVSDWLAYLENSDVEGRCYERMFDEANKKINRYIGKITNQCACIDDNTVIDDSQQHFYMEMAYPIVTIKNNQSASDRINTTIREYAENSAEWVKEAAIADFSDEDAMAGIANYDLYSDYSIEKNSKGVVSILMNYFDYMGGAHGSYYCQPYNYNTVTGEEINFGDFFVEGYDYNQAIIDEVKNQINESRELNEVYFEEGLSDYILYYQDNGIVVLYNPYVIAPYAAGQPTFFIPFDFFGKALK